MSEAELEETCEIVNKDLEDFTNALNRLQEQKEVIKEALREEEDCGNEYTQKHIQKIKTKVGFEVAHWKYVQYFNVMWFAYKKRVKHCLFLF